MATSTQIVTIAGIPRSGTTFAYNVVRIALAVKYGWHQVAFGCGLRVAGTQKPAAAVKQHDFDPRLQQLSTQIIHSTRNYDSALESMRRMDSQTTLTIAEMTVNHRSWAPYATFTFEHSQLARGKLALVTSLVDHIGSQAIPKEVLEMVESLRPPTSGGPDPITLLMPNHLGPLFSNRR